MSGKQSVAMKILLLTDSDAFAGTERHILDLAKGLRDESVDAIIGCPEKTPLARAALESGLPCVVVSRSSRAAIKTLANLIKTQGFDCVHAHNGRSALFAAVAGAGAKRTGCRLVSTLHFITLARESRGGLKGWVSRWIHAWVNQRTDRWIAISDAVVAATVKRDPAMADRVVRIHNGSAPPLAVRTRDEVRHDLGLPSERKLILTVARLEVEKDAQTLLDAAERLAKEGCGNWTWVIAGEGALGEQLRERAAQNWPKASPVCFLGRRDDVSDLMGAADILIHPAPAEPFGLVLTEAMAAGLPVVASSGGAAPEIIVEGETGLMFVPGDGADLAVKIQEVLAHADLKAWGKDGQKRFVECFTAARMANDITVLYREILMSVPGAKTLG